jgi:cytochrome d ubiquinol oxidase subunit II
MPETPYLPGIDLPDIVAGTMVLAVTMYVLLAGADFGGGVWDLFARGPRRQAQRDLVADAIGPIWEANHVWLILVVVILFGCFPPAFSQLAIALHVPITLMLVGIVLRGSAFTFRSYDSRRDEVQRRWGLVFSIASLVTPVLLGVCLGAVVSGAVGDSQQATDAAGRFLWPWLTPLPWGLGLLTLVLFAFLAAVYLTVEAKDPALQEDFRWRAVQSAVVAFLLGGVVLLIARRDAPFVWEVVVASPRAIVVQAATAASAVVAVWALWTRRYRVARVAAILEVSCMVWGWAWAQWPYLIPPSATIDQLAAPPITLKLVLVGLGAGLVILVPSFWYLFRIFKGRPRAFAGDTLA